MEFLYDERPLGYCDCEYEDEGYNEKYECCGYSCNFTAPSFRIEKITDLNYCTWNGSESDYWEYKEKFESNRQNNNKEVEKYKLEQKKQDLIYRIKELQDELDELENEEIIKEFGSLKLVK